MSDWGQVDRRVQITNELLAERIRQDQLHGEQRGTKDGTGPQYWAYEDIARADYELAKEEKRITFAHILTEEVGEALCEIDQSRLRAELVQVAAVAVKWIEEIDRRKNA